MAALMNHLTYNLLPMMLHTNCTFNSAFTVTYNQQPLKI